MSAPSGSPAFHPWTYDQHHLPDNGYGSTAAAATMKMDIDLSETTGSLTGHILAHGCSDPDTRGNTRRTVVVMLVLLSAMVVVTVLAIG